MKCPNKLRHNAVRDGLLASSFLIELIEVVPYRYRNKVLYYGLCFIPRLALLACSHEGGGRGEIDVID